MKPLKAKLIRCCDDTHVITPPTYLLWVSETEQGDFVAMIDSKNKLEALNIATAGETPKYIREFDAYMMTRSSEIEIITLTPLVTAGVYAICTNNLFHNRY